jgi:hypothetical protein
MRYDATSPYAVEATGLVKRFGKTTTLAGFGQPLLAVRAHGLQHPVPRSQVPVRTLACGDDRLID